MTGVIALVIALVVLLVIAGFFAIVDWAFGDHDETVSWLDEDWDEDEYSSRLPK